MSATDITNIGPKGSNDTSGLHSRQAKSTASENDLSDELGGMKLGVDEKTPRQDATAQGMSPFAAHITLARPPPNGSGLFLSLHPQPMTLV